MIDTTTLAQIAQIIQLAVTPVFMIVGIAGLLNVLTGRHGRMIDRSRALQKGLAKVTEEVAVKNMKAEQRRLKRRLRFSHFAISMATFSAITVCSVVVALFVGQLFALDVALLVSIMFIVCMCMLITAFIAFLGEVLICSFTLQASLRHTDTYHNE